MRAVHIIISGRVQGVGYRAWTEREALARGLAGWVRNRLDGSVEALFAGDEEAVESILASCRRGPHAARVVDIEVSDADVPANPGFSVLATDG